MTTASYVGRLRRGRGHTYLLDDERVPSVTAIKDVLDSPALIKWAAQQSAAWAIDHWDRLSREPLSLRYREIEDARFKSSGPKREKGTRIHFLADRLGRDEEVRPPDELLPMVQAYADFLDDW